ncbi:ATP-grasp domain-containing protein [Streptomyces rimosus]|uniref:ATP-grasp domain-containing protein n=1 Tax=Streptomyces rimosus TaxID=1927 RepID=UPI00067C236D|nr:ATP-grasp domain-containing protein [Streptomyces rimosus]
MPKRLLVLHAASPLGPEEAERLVKALDVQIAFVVLMPQVTGGRAELDRLAALGPVLEVTDPRELVPAALSFAATHQVDGVLASSELLLAAGAAVAEALGLPHHPVSAMPALLRKDVQRERLRAAGVPTPAWAIVRGPDDIPAALSAVPLPAVLKPVRGMGSIATFDISTPEVLERCVEEGRRVCSETLPTSGEEPVFQLEEYLGGDQSHPADPRLDDMFSVECLLFEGEIHHVVVGAKPPQAPPFRDAGHIVPSALPQDLRDAVVDMAEQAIRAVGAYHGAVLVQVKLTASGPRVIEVNGRNGFALPLVLLPHGYDYLTDIARVALGEQPQLPGRFSGYSMVQRRYAPLEAEEVTAVRGVAAAAQLPGVQYLVPLLDVGQRPDPLRPSKSVAYLLGARAGDLASLLDLADRVADRVVFEYRTVGAPPAG